MRWILCIAVTVMVIAGTVQQVLAAVNMEDGNWEIKMETSVDSGGGSKLPGGLGVKLSAPSVPTGSSTVNKCLTQADLVPGVAAKDQKCEVRNVNVSGNTVTWSVACVIESGGTVDGQGEITYSGATMSGQVKNTVSPKNGKSVASTIKLMGKKTGPCDK